MSKKNEKQAASLALQLISLCDGNEELVRKAEIVKDEFNRITEIEKTISSPTQLMLNKVLHSTRAFDTGMRTFLDLFGALPEEHNRGLGPYLSQLKKGKPGCFGRLNGDLAERMKTNVVNDRNVYLHAAGEYPTKARANEIVNDILSYLQTILNLA